MIQPLFSSHKSTYRQWARAIEAERVPQAVLLTGPEGSGLLPLALNFVAYLQCTDRDEEAMLPCGICEACRANARLAHPDVHYTFPVVGRGRTSSDFVPDWRTAVQENVYLSQSEWLRRQTSDNKQGNINKDEVYSILHAVSLQRFTRGYKVILIWGADQLGDESNRLLKLIEEPPERTLILLVTSRFERILPTIYSRCRIFRVPPVPADDLIDVLVQRGSSPQQAQEIAYSSGGSITRAVRTLQLQEEAPESEPDLAGWLRDCYTGKGAGIVKRSATLAALTRERQKFFVHRALRFVRELGVVLAGTQQSLRLSPEETKVAHKLASLIDWPKLTALSRELEELLRAVERNANGKIAFTATSIRIHHILARQRKAA